MKDKLHLFRHLDTEADDGHSRAAHNKIGVDDQPIRLVAQGPQLLEFVIAVTLLVNLECLRFPDPASVGDKTPPL